MICSKVMNRIANECPEPLDSLAELILYNEYIQELVGDNDAGQRLLLVQRIKSGDLKLDEITFIGDGEFITPYGQRLAINENMVKRYELYVMKAAMDWFK